MLKQLSICYGVMLTMAAQLAAAVLGGDISVTVKGDDGTNVASASVLVERIVELATPQTVRWKQRTEWNTTTSSAGLFHLSGLPFGHYAFCVQAPNTPWLNPCEWDSTRPELDISPAQLSVNKTITLKRGATVSVRVNDPAKLLPQYEGKAGGAHLLVGVRGPKLMIHLAPVRAEDSGGRNYEVVIPFDTGTNLIVTSPFFQLRDANGMALSATGKSSVRLLVPSGKEPPKFNFTVDGHR